MPTLTPLFDALESRFGKSGLLSDSNDLRLYEYDGGVDRHLPDVVVFPRTTEDVVFVVKAAKEHGVSIVGRGAGTGLAAAPFHRREVLSFLLADEQDSRDRSCQ